jgi:uncharacterized protein
MTLKYNCPSCNSLLYTQYLKPGEQMLCRTCGQYVIVPENAQPAESLADIARMAAQKREQKPVEESVAGIAQPAIPEPQPRLPNYRYPGFWQAIGLMGLFLLIFIALYLPLGFVSAIAQVKLHRIPAVENIVEAIAYTLVLVMGLRIGNLPFKEVFVFNKVKPGFILSIAVCWLGIVSIVLTLVYWIAITFSVQDRSNFYQQLALDHPYSMFFSLVVIAPIFEELFFRGLLLRGFLARYSAKKALLVNAILFAVVHGHPLKIFATFFLGLFNGWLRLKTNSIIPSIFSHSLNNGLVYLVFIIAKNKELPETPESVQFWEPCLLLLIGIILFALGYYFIRKQISELPVSENIPHQAEINPAVSDSK